MKHLDTIYLDYDFLRVIEGYALAEGFLSGRSAVRPDEQPFAAVPPAPCVKPSHVDGPLALQLVAFANSIDSFTSEYAPSDWVASGLVKPDAHMIDERRHPLFDDRRPADHLPSHERALLLGAESVANELVRRFRDTIISEYLANGRAPAGIDEATLTERYDLVVAAAVRNDPELHDRYPAAGDFENEVFSHFQSLYKGLYFSGLNLQSFATSYHRALARPESVAATIGELGDIVAAHMGDEIQYWPAPTTLSEALQMRDRPEMRAFRNVVAEWVEALQGGSEDAVKNMRRDLQTANVALKAIGQWKKVKGSDWYFWFNRGRSFAKEHIPGYTYFDYTLKVVDVVDRYVVPKLEQKFSWISLLRGATAG